MPAKTGQVLWREREPEPSTSEPCRARRTYGELTNGPLGTVFRLGSKDRLQP